MAWQCEVEALGARESSYGEIGKAKGCFPSGKAGLDGGTGCTCLSEHGEGRRRTKLGGGGEGKRANTIAWAGRKQKGGWAWTGSGQKRKFEFFYLRVNKGIWNLIFGIIGIIWNWVFLSNSCGFLSDF
jgi:hypothetical protein